ncbi:hypothetical protein [Paenibacillus harenae]|uniref:hypothetical protein n=1 Tax=Paenibacillus harenae TaxID=306543 RepID=UPI0003FAE8A7|nr:hypothetical protein [Paenibacillus harenae]
MKHLWIVMVIALFIVVGCTSNLENGSEKDAIKELVENQTGDYSVHVFSNVTLDENFQKKVNEKINEINNQFLKEDGITNVSFIDTRDKEKYDYDKILKLDSYPQILLFQKEEVIFRTSNPDDLYQYFKDMNS